MNYFVVRLICAASRTAEVEQKFTPYGQLLAFLTSEYEDEKVTLLITTTQENHDGACQQAATDDTILDYGELQ